MRELLFKTFKVVKSNAKIKKDFLRAKILMKF